ncbi:hypothetical protein PFLUV_G00139090 [Perca fluviatilis]|uniref:DBIRD complex subunit ZNF326 n=2 Tax=Perca fluviatilis TaxID=8168 RepID=A0A6A5F0B8_PERFL|nr:DBIRD complex subunit ZNF326-like isoform X1 [Perca fluviatilis]KAF1384129.1 hypothetical protein PFLUV_G00139090 [Perca fluviatilis]
MNRPHNIPFNPSAAAAQVLYNQQQCGRIPQDFKEAMLHIPVKPAVDSNIRTPGKAAKTQPAQKRAVKSSADKWKSSFKPLGEEDDSPDTRTGSSEKVEIYNPYDPDSSDSEHEMTAQGHNHSPPDQDEGCLKKGRWDRSYSESASRLLDRCDFSPETRPTESRGFSTGHRLPERQAYAPTTESLDRPGFDSISRPLDHRVCSPERHVHGSSTQRFLASYGGQRTNGEERIIIPEYSREMTTTVRLSPPRLQRDYQHQLEYVDTGLDHVKPSTEVPRSRKIIMDKSPIICDLCEVELANGRELEEHLESKSHWDTLEHIQQQNNYDDLAIAFIQDVMLYKSQQFSRNIEDSALQALQDNDHMTKIEMFHCAACSVFISTSASSVQTHITSQEHLSNTKDFQVQQRRSCLAKAETMMKEMKPQFEHFLKGGSPFE